MARGLNVFVSIGGKVNASLGSAASSVERRFGLMNQRLRVMAAESSAHLARTERRWGRFSRSANDFAWSISGPMSAMSMLGTRSVYEWSKVGNELQAVSQMSDTARKNIESVARGMIGDPAENLRAALDLARTGFENDVIAGAMPVVLRLAKSDPSVDMAAAADIATNIIQGMRIPVEQFESAADKLAFAASKSSTDIRLLGLSFKYAGPIAARMGSNMNEMSAAFMTMANAGIKGSESGVAMRSMFVRMVKPTKGSLASLGQLRIDLGDFVKGRRAGTGDDVANFLRADGVDINKQAVANIDRIIGSGLKGGELYAAITDAVVAAGGEGASAIDRSALSSSIVDALTSQADKVDWVGFMGALRDKGATAAQINTIFDSRQGTRLMTLMSGDDLNRNLRLMRDGAPGWLMKMFNTSTKGIVGSFGRLQQSIGNLLISMAESGVIDTFANGMDRLSKAMMGLSKTNPALLKAITWGILSLAVAGPIGMMMGGIVSGIRALGFIATLAAPAVRFLGRGLVLLAGRSAWIRGAFLALRIAAFAGLGGLAAVGWPAVAVLAGLALAIGWVVAKWNGIKAFFAGFAKGFSEALSPETMVLIKGFGNFFVGIWKGIGDALKPVLDLLGAVFGWIGKIFAPAETEKWRAGGQAFGGVIAGMVNGLADFITKIGEAIGKVREFFSNTSSGRLNIAPIPLGATGPVIGPPRQAGARARGGSWGGSRPYLVGERGPELAVPGRSGTIIPAHVLAAISRGGFNPRERGPEPAMFGVANLFDASLANKPAPGAAGPRERGPEPAMFATPGTIIPAHVLAAISRGTGSSSVAFGDIHIHGATDPAATARAVRAELTKMARAQGAALHD